MNRTLAGNCCVLTIIALLGLPVGEVSGQPKTKAKQPVRAPFQRIKDKPGLPRVLLIGDSISIGYTVPVRTLIGDKVNVHRALTNCGPTTKGLKELSKWIGDQPWDVIHFNWGLHELCLRV